MLRASSLALGSIVGPDGMLYIGMGDGGSQGDPHGNGQNPTSLLAKLLRINVDRGDPYGWNIMEGPSCHRASGCNRPGLQRPALSYPHENSVCSVIGGFVYRGQKIPEIQGQYFYSDYCNSWLRSFGFADGKVTDQHERPVGRLGSITSFGEDSQRELYITTSSGRVYRIIKSPGNPGR